jgi:hypothetical protein
MILQALGLSPRRAIGALSVLVTTSAGDLVTAADVEFVREAQAFARSVERSVGRAVLPRSGRRRGHHGLTPEAGPLEAATSGGPSVLPGCDSREGSSLMFKKLPGDQISGLVSTTPDTAVFRPAVVQTPAVVTIAIFIGRLLAGQSVSSRPGPGRARSCGRSCGA